MSKSTEKIQIFYEIAMAIGKSLDLQKMLKSALLTYLRKLNCVAGMVYKLKHSDKKIYYVEDLFSIPYTLKIKKNYEYIDLLLSRSFTEKELSNFCKKMPITGKTKDGHYYHIMKLDDFGFIVLIKNNKQLEKEILFPLIDLNNKLAQACFACLNNNYLFENEQKHRDLIEFLPLMIYEINVDGYITYANNYTFKVTGYIQKDIINGFHFSTLFHPSEKTSVNNNFKIALEMDNPPPKEFKIITKNGETLSTILYTSKLKINNKVTGLRNVMIDITKRKVNEKKLKDNEKYLKTINQFAKSVLKHNTIDEIVWEVIRLMIKELGFIDCIIYLVDENKKNLIQRAAYGFKNKGNTVKDPIIIPFGRGIVGTVAITGIPELVTDTSKDPRYIVDDQFRYSELAVPIIADGEVIGVIDTEHPEKDFYTKEHLEKLQTVSGLVSSRIKNAINQEKLELAQVSLSKLSTAIEQSPLSVMITDLNGIIEFVNPAFIETTGYSTEESIGKKTSILNSGEHSQSLYVEMWKVINKGEKWIGELINKKKNGEKFWVLNSISPIRNNEGVITNFVAMHADISAHKKLERDLILAKENAEEANKAKSEFLANMSHEIRTPMNAILGFSEALYHKLDSYQHKKMIKSVLSSGNLLLSLLNDILDLSKIEAGKLEISPQPVNLRNIIQEIKLLFTDKAHKKGLEIDSHLINDFPDVIRLDEIRIKQVIFNLVGNALKFTHKGFVNIKADFIKKTAEKGELIIEVTDTGIGIPKLQQELIFEAFSQQSGQSDRKYGGAGLGLAISKRLVKKMNGDIEVSSEINKGSVFKIRIPQVEISTIKIRKKDYSNGIKNIIFEKATVLVIDDVSSNIETVENLISPVGLSILSAENGEIALEILSHTIPELIMLDIRMPGIDGYEVAQSIKSNPKLSHIPVIAFTASVFSSDKIENTGNFNGSLFKPINRTELLQMLAKFLKHSVIRTDKQKTDKIIRLDNISKDLKNKLPEILKELKNNLLPKWKVLQNQFVLFKIEEFAIELKKLAQKFNFGFLIQYADNIIDDLDIIDLESLNKTLSEYPKIINKIELLIKN